jgi:hypothetical protein
MVLLASLTLALARQTWGANEIDLDEPSRPLFGANELCLDLYNTYTASEPDGFARVLGTNIRHGDFGAGLGVTYWPTANFGAGLDANIPRLDEVRGVLFHQVSLNFTARLPLGHFAPYGFGGLGRDFQSGLWSSHAGVGLEWRFQRQVGAFVDARYVFASHETDSLMMRAGVRFPF